MNTVEEAWNEFHDEAQQCIDPLEVIVITSEIMGTPLHASWLNYIEELRKMAWWDHFVTSKDMIPSVPCEQRLIFEKVRQALENRNNPFAPKPVLSVKGEPLECPFVKLPESEPMEIDEQLSTDFANKLLIQ